MKRPSESSATGRYHHGDLRRALLEAAAAAPDIEHISLRELASGLGVSAAAAQADRVASARAIARRYRSLVVLKGNGSVIAAPDGKFWINSSGNPGMASAGMGDALAGMIAALVAQGAEPLRALLAGVYLHGAAADALVAAGVGPAGITASEVIDRARVLLNRRG